MEYVKNQRDAGVSDDQIRLSLQTSGWGAEDINAAMGSVGTGLSGEGSGKSFLITYFLSQFFGVLGIDRFYLGKIGTGILKLITFGGAGIWALVDLILILSNKMKTKDGKTLDGYKEGRKVAFAVFGLIVLINLIGWTSVIFKIKNGVNKTYTYSSDTSSLVATEKKTSPSTSVETPFGSSVQIGDLAIKVSKVTMDPQVQGDAPDAGKQYVKVTLDITNNGATADSVLGSKFYYMTQSGDQLNTANTFTSDLNGQTSGKNIYIDGERAVVFENVEPGTTTTGYLIYQIPQGDQGKLILHEDSYNPNSSSLAIFQLR